MSQMGEKKPTPGYYGQDRIEAQFNRLEADIKDSMRKTEEAKVHIANKEYRKADDLRLLEKEAAIRLLEWLDKQEQV